MMDFIYNLYQNDNFTLYLTIALVVLIIIFVLVLVLGKKDQKLEETKRLQKIELDAFKKEEEKPEVVEIKEEKEEPLVREEVTVTEFKPDVIEEEPEIELPNLVRDVRKPIFSDHEEEQSPISLSDLPEINNEVEDKEIEDGLNILASIKNEFEEIELPKEVSTPEVHVEEPVETPVEKPIFKPSPVFSSVFVNKEDSVINETKPVFEESKEEVVAPVVETPVIEDIPKVETPIVEIPKIETPIIEVEKEVVKEPEPVKFNKMFIIEDDEELELPTLKKDNALFEEEKTFSFNDVNGENYKL